MSGAPIKSPSSCSRIPLLPIGSVRSVVTINNPPSPSPSPSPSSSSSSPCVNDPARCSTPLPSLFPSKQHITRQRRHGLPIGLSRWNVSPPSVAMTIFYPNQLNGGEFGTKDDDANENVGHNNCDCITMVATCTASSRAGADNDENKSGGRISLATIIESTVEEGRGCREVSVAGMRYSSSSSSSSSSSDSLSFSTVGIIRIPQRLDTSLSTTIIRPLLIAIDTCGKLHTCLIRHQDGTKSSPDCKEDHLLDMQECHFGIHSSIPVKRGRKSKSSKGKPPPTDSTTSVNDSQSQLPPLIDMNSLTARLECTSAVNGAESGSNCMASRNDSSKLPATKTPTKRKARKRKQSATDHSGTNHAAVTIATNTERIYLVASNLNGSILPSQSPPVVMLLNSSEASDSIKSCKWTGMAWSKIPGLEHVHVPMTCILFASRSSCQPKIWDGITSTIRSNNTDAAYTGDPNQTQCDEGLILMGFQDGSLRASLVFAKKVEGTDSRGDPPMHDVSLDISKATILLHLSGDEPFVSLQLISMPSSGCTTREAYSIPGPILICIGALGSMVALASSTELDEKNGRHDVIQNAPKFVMGNVLKSCGGRWLSMSCVGYCFSDNRDDDLASSASLDSIHSIDVSFVGVNDSRHAFLHRWSVPYNRRSLEKANNRDCDDQSVYRLPIPPRVAFSIHAFPRLLYASSKDSSNHITFAISAPNGKAIVSRMPLPTMKVTSQTTFPSMELLHRGSVVKYFLSSAPKGKAGTADETTDVAEKFRETSQYEKNQPSKLQPLLQKLELATWKQNKNETNHVIDLFNRQSDHATREIREATQIAAYIKQTSSTGNMRSPMQCEIKKRSRPNSGMLECIVTAEKLPLAKLPATVWLPSVHILQSCLNALSPMLRPGSIKSMPPLCYRRTVRRGDGTPSIVLYGGTATSYSGCDINRGLQGSLGRTMNISVPMNDFIPVSAYASLSMIYAANTSENVQGIHGWSKSAKIVDTSSHDRWQPMRRTHKRAVPSEVLHLNGSAKHVGFHCGNRFGNEEFLGISIPFHMGTKVNNTPLLHFDILASNTSSGHRHDVMDSEGEKSARDAAENQVKNQSSQTNSGREYVIPSIKEQHSIRYHSRSSTRPGGAEDATVYCCSTLMQCTSACDTLLHGKEVYCANLGFGPMSIVRRPGREETDTISERGIGDLGIAIGSNKVTPSESMAILPLIRQAIARRCLEELIHPPKKRKSVDDPKLLESYIRIVSDKQTAKLAKYITRSSDELLINIEKLQDDTRDNLCPKDVLASSILLYETMRTILITL